MYEFWFVNETRRIEIIQSKQAASQEQEGHIFCFEMRDDDQKISHEKVGNPRGALFCASHKKRPSCGADVNYYPHHHLIIKYIMYIEKDIYVVD